MAGCLLAILFLASQNRVFGVFAHGRAQRSLVLSGPDCCLNAPLRSVIYPNEPWTREPPIGAAVLMLAPPLMLGLKEHSVLWPASGFRWCHGSCAFIPIGEPPGFAARRP
ncbi:MAG: hypothetical protein JO132_11840 [Streptosporangiaceae bacterium]|nr:hypothetical protein [Streptosporangiaceae bacterium]